MITDTLYLSIEEKRAWLADIFRDVSGEFSQSDKFKAMIEDTKLAQILEEQAELLERRKQEEENAPEMIDFASLLQSLPPPSLVSTERLKELQ